MLLGLSSILLLIFATSFFVASEYSIVSVRRTRVEQLVSEGNARAARVKHALEHLDAYIAAVQIGITIATLGMGALGEPILGHLLEPLLAPLLTPLEAYITSATISIALAFLIVTILEIVLGEIVPKIFARQRAEATALLLIRPLEFFVFIFRPVIWLVSMMSNVVLRLLGLNPGDEHTSVYSVEELEMLVTSSRQAGVLDRTEEVILRRVFDFGDLLARQVMRPRTEIDAIEISAGLPEVMQIISEKRHSRFPVYEGDLDHIRGVLHVKDVLLMSMGLPRMASRSDKGQVDGAAVAVLNGSFSVSALMRPINAVPETVNVGELLNRMKHAGDHMVLVVDEYGGTAGVVTLEDIVEEIVGEVRDEFEPREAGPNIVVTPSGTMVDGLAAIDEVNDALDLNIESEADTLGGFVFETLGRKPELGDQIKYKGYTFTVEALDNLRIARVRITKTQPERQPAEVAPDEE